MDLINFQRKKCGKVIAACWLHGTKYHKFTMQSVIDGSPLIHIVLTGPLE
jgi:hypothetical protein